MQRDPTTRPMATTPAMTRTAAWTRTQRKEAVVSGVGADAQDLVSRDVAPVLPVKAQPNEVTLAKVQLVKAALAMAFPAEALQGEEHLEGVAPGLPVEAQPVEATLAEVKLGEVAAVAAAVEGHEVGDEED